MKICENGIIRDASESEIAAMHEAAARAAAEEKHRPLSLMEVQEMLVRQQVNTLDVDDQTALRMVEFYPDWAADTAYTTAAGRPAGYKVQHNGKLWKLRQEHTSQVGWEPENTASLWERIDETHDGSLYDPIPYDGSMALESGKHYSQGGAVYLCTRGTGNPVYHPLSELVGLYVETVI